MQCSWYYESTSRFLGYFLAGTGKRLCSFFPFRRPHSSVESGGDVEASICPLHPGFIPPPPNNHSSTLFLIINLAHQRRGILTHALHGLVRSPEPNQFPLRADQKLPEVPLWGLLCRFWKKRWSTLVIHDTKYTHSVHGGHPEGPLRGGWRFMQNVST